MNPDRNAVLVLSTYRTGQYPFIVDFNGKYVMFFVNADFIYSGNRNDDLNFEYGRATDVAGGCGALLRNVFWYFGGGIWGSNSRQVRLVKDLFNIYLFSGEQNCWLQVGASDRFDL